MCVCVLFLINSFLVITDCLLACRNNDDNNIIIKIANTLLFNG